MAKNSVEGTCNLCGAYGKLSFEHVPPKAAFNDKPVRLRHIVDAMQDDLFGSPPGRVQQRGAGGYTLCEQCNNHTGDWYARDFAKWCWQGMDVLIRSEGRPKLIYLHYIYPLRVIKQVYAMAFSLNHAEWRKRHPKLEQFVLDRERRWLDPLYRVFVYYTGNGGFRQVNEGMALYRLGDGRVIKVTELSFPPFGYVITTDGTVPDPQLFEITHFRRYEYDELEVAPLYLPVLPTHMPVPLDYRTREEIEEEAERSKAAAARLQSHRLHSA